MYAAGFGLIWVVLLLGGFGFPLGVPPLPEDPMMAKIAPQECLFYMSSSGMATPKAASGNQTEQFLAEPEVQEMMAEIERAIKTGLARTMKRVRVPQTISVEEIVDLTKLLLGRPMAVYVSGFQMWPDGPAVRGGAIVHVGDNAAKLETALAEITKHMLPARVEGIEIGGQQWRGFKPTPGISVVWGFKNSYFLIALGEGEIETMLKRFDGAPPAWLAKIRQEDLTVDRVSTVAYVNLKAVVSLAAPMAGPRTARMLETLGLNNVTTLASVTGLDQKGCVSKTLLSIDGEPEGVFRLANAKPLTPADLAPIPRDATIALALKLDPEQAFDAILAVAERIDPYIKAKILSDIGAQEDGEGLKVRDDFLKSLGDTWCMFDSPSEGGVLSGLTLVAPLKDPKRAAAANARLLKLWQARFARLKKKTPFRSNPQLEKLEFAGREIHVFQSGSFGFPSALAWCLTDKELIVSLFPQSIKAYLSRRADFKSLAELPEIARLFHGDAGPVKLAYGNSQRLFDVLYPKILCYMKPMIRRTGIDMKASALPSANAIRPHLTPAVAAVRRTKSGVELIEWSPLPGIGAISSYPKAFALLLPPILDARENARRMQSTCHMKQIGLAMHNYAAVHKTFPPAYTTDKNGKPLLSWRVLLVPYLEGDNLYKQFHLDEPWDSDHNKKLIIKMPQVYKSPNSKVSGQWKTNYLTVRGGHTMFPGKNKIGFGDVTDGLSNTIMTVEVSDQKAIIWTKPDDFQYDEKDPLKGLIGLWPAGFNAGLADGSVRFFPASIDPKTLKTLFIRDDGEAVDWDALDR